MWHDGSPVQPSPRQVLAGADRARGRARASRRWSAPSSSSTSSSETFAEAHAKDYAGLTPSVPYILDYHILATTYDEPFLRAIRNGMQAAGIRVETSKGEAWPGQQEINFRFADALTMADNHVDLQERRQGDRVPPRLLDHVHGEAVPGLDRQLVPHPLVALARRRGRASRTTRRCSRAGSPGQIACAKELAVFFAPTINSYKRYAAGSWAPTTLAWGNDNRTCGYPGRRATARRGGSRRGFPGGDANPYLAFAAVIAVRAPRDRAASSSRRRPLEGNAYESDADRFPSTMREAIAALEAGTMARAAFGDQVVDHYLNYARTEQGLYDRFVTDWERTRYFERG